jgi:hypothetical protein
MLEKEEIFDEFEEAEEPSGEPDAIRSEEIGPDA